VTPLARSGGQTSLEALCRNAYMPEEGFDWDTVAGGKIAEREGEGPQHAAT